MGVLPAARRLHAISFRKHRDKFFFADAKHWDDDAVFRCKNVF